MNQKSGAKRAAGFSRRERTEKLACRPPTAYHAQGKGGGKREPPENSVTLYGKKQLQHPNRDGYIGLLFFVLLESVAAMTAYALAAVGARKVSLPLEFPTVDDDAGILKTLDESLYLCTLPGSSASRCVASRPPVPHARTFLCSELPRELLLAN